MARASVLGSATRVDPEPGDRAWSAEDSRAVADATEVSLRLPDGRELRLTGGLIKVLAASAEELSAGHAVTVLPSEVLLTPAEVGELLGLSRPFVARLIDGGDLPAEHLPESRHRVVRLTDVLAFQERRERRRTGRRAISAAVDEADLPY